MAKRIKDGSKLWDLAPLHKRIDALQADMETNRKLWGILCSLTKGACFWCGTEIGPMVANRPRADGLPGFHLCRECVLLATEELRKGGLTPTF